MSMRSSSSSDDDKQTWPQGGGEQPAAAGAAADSVEPLSSLLHRVVLQGDVECLDDLASSLRAAHLGMQGLLDLLVACEPAGRPITAGALRQLLLPIADAVQQASTAATGLYQL